MAGMGEVVSTLGRGPARLRRLLDRLPAGFSRVASSTGWLMVGHVAQLATGLLVGIYVARYLGPESYGLLNYAIGFALLFSALAHLGLGDIVVRDLVARAGEQGQTLGSAFALRVASGALTLALVAAAAWATQTDATTRLMIVVIATSLFFEAMSAPAEWFQSKIFTRPMVLTKLISMAVASLLRVAFVLLGKPVVWFAWPVVIDVALATAVAFMFYRWHGGPRIANWRPIWGRMRELLAQSWPLALSGGLVQIQHRIDQVMLGEMLGPTEVGWYAAAVRLSQLWYVVPFALSTAVFPLIVHAKETSQKLYDRHMQAFFDFVLWLAVAISLPATLVAQPLIHLLYGEGFAPSAGVLQIHIWSLVLNSLVIATSHWMMVERLTRALLGFSVVSVLSNILLNLLLIPGYGAVGAAWATLAAYGPILLLRFFYRPTRPTVLMMLRAFSAPVCRLIPSA
jgi:O-antigen/teichoic acid export membrane protein